TAWWTTAMSVDFGGDDATSVQRPKFRVHDRSGTWPDDVAGGEPCVHAGRSTTTLHRRCLPALLVGNSQCGTDHGLHAQTTRQFERGLPQGFRQANRPICFGEISK